MSNLLNYYLEMFKQHGYKITDLTAFDYLVTKGDISILFYEYSDEIFFSVSMNNGPSIYMTLDKEIGYSEFFHELIKHNIKFLENSVKTINQILLSLGTCLWEFSLNNKHKKYVKYTKTFYSTLIKKNLEGINKWSL